MPSSPADHHYLEQVLLSLGSWLLPRPSCFGDRVLLSICELGFGFLRLQGLGSSVVGSQADSVRQSMTPKFNSPSRVPALLQVPAVLSHDFVSSPKPFKSGIFSYFTNVQAAGPACRKISHLWQFGQVMVINQSAALRSSLAGFPGVVHLAGLPGAVHLAGFPGMVQQGLYAREKE